MDVNQLMVLGVFFSTIFALVASNMRPSTIFAVAMLILLVSQQITFDEIDRKSVV